MELEQGGRRTLALAQGDLERKDGKRIGVSGQHLCCPLLVSRENRPIIASQRNATNQNERTTTAPPSPAGNAVGLPPCSNNGRGDTMRRRLPAQRMTTTTAVTQGGEENCQRCETAKEMFQDEDEAKDR
ncbi:hypothetical protein MTO96_049017 [Rhipicephalus appendiculatus]